ncbi:DUF427 domain-containing protein [Streptomyces sp. NPDC002206]
MSGRFPTRCGRDPCRAALRLSPGRCPHRSAPTGGRTRHRSALRFHTLLRPPPRGRPRSFRLDLFAATGLRTGCPYKGTVEYWSVADTDSDAPANVAWSYPDPAPAAGAVKDLIAF